MSTGYWAEEVGEWIINNILLNRLRLNKIKRESDIGIDDGP